MVTTMGRKYHIGEKSTVLMYTTYINRHAGVVANSFERLTRVVEVRPLLLSLWCTLPSPGDSDGNLCISLSTYVRRFFLMEFGLVSLSVRTNLIKLLSIPRTDRTGGQMVGPKVV